ncbi:TetR/AcrR family transcriptional regulator [Streptomyces erythrochromogenes]|uniref:TetR/AcrR family transcriptional regulator n=1 Tax=Streptomyces erythrochromogenes TaxID=285574 RepID=UPI00386BBD64|nr:TetR/AcrR family transcriptional regulator [Streptomyces erythrochromogenes]
MWLVAGPVPSGRRRTEAPSGLDREWITAATVRLLDADGLTRFSMRRLAAGLGVTAMSPYWYADTKPDLLEPPWTGPRASRPCRPGNRSPAGRVGRAG